MLYVGLDIHTKHIALCVLSQAGQLVQRARGRGLEEMLRLLKGLPDRFEVCYEASCGYGHYHDLLQPLAARVLVAHPGQLRLVFRSKSKNDRNDAERLAKLLYLGETPTVHVLSLDVRAWRELINCRAQVIAKRTRAKNALRAAAGGGRGAPQAPRPVDEEGPGLAPPARAAHGLAAAVAGPAARGGRGAHRPGAAPRAGAEPPGAADAGRRPAAHHPRGGDPHGRGGGRVPRRPAAVSPRQGGRQLLRAGAVPGPVGREEPAGAHHPRGAGGRLPPRRRGRVAGGAALADGPRVLRAGPARRPAAEEERGGGDGALLGARHVGAAEAGDRLAGGRGRGPVAPARGRPRGGVLSPPSPSAEVKGDGGERTPGKQAVASARQGRAW